MILPTVVLDMLALQPVTVDWEKCWYNTHLQRENNESMEKFERWQPQN